MQAGIYLAHFHHAYHFLMARIHSHSLDKGGLLIVDSEGKVFL